jgi:hypothetical protein
MASVLVHVNNVLAQIGEQPLTSTVGNLGNLVKRELQSALYSVVSQTRHTAFLSTTDFTVSAVSALTPSFALPTRTIQIKTLFYKDTSTPTLPRVVPILPRDLSVVSQPGSLGYAVVGSNVHVGQGFARPFTATLYAYTAPALPPLDTDLLTLPDEILFALESVAAAAVASSYIDDLAQQRSLQTRAEQEVLQLRARAGSMRAPISWTS